MKYFKNNNIGNFSKQSLTEVSLQQEKCHRIGINENGAHVSILKTNDQQQSFRPLVNSTVDQFMADHVAATIQDLFQVISVLDLLTIYQLL